VLVAIGGAAITLLNSILTADLIPLQYRGLAQGILSTPYLVTSWYTSEIAAALGTSNNCTCIQATAQYVRTLY
jgi:hypothetical protein